MDITRTLVPTIYETSINTFVQIKLHHRIFRLMPNSLTVNPCLPIYNKLTGKVCTNKL